VRIGVLTAGGDAPGLNAAVRAIGRRALAAGHEVLGVRNGFAGVAGPLDAFALTRADLSGIVGLGGTLLGSVRHDLDHPDGGRARVLETVAAELDALVTIGGDGTMHVAQWLAERGCAVVGVPKTLDNDLAGTEYCIGFDTAVGIVTEALDRLHTTAASHHRVIVLETMGRASGWVAAMGALAGGADYVVIPEFPVGMAEIVEHIHHRRRLGSSFSIVVVAEGVDPVSLGATGSPPAELDAMGRVRVASHSVGHYLAGRIGELTGFETRCTVLGHVQRGGSPSAHDRIWASHVGSAAYDAVLEGDWGAIPVVRAGQVVRARISEVIARPHPVPRGLYELCATFF
jgi:6-phosphofructokinase 1